MESTMPTLDSILAEVDQFVESDKSYNDAPHVIDVILPLLCAYLPVWWNQGPDNVSLTAGYVPSFMYFSFVAWKTCVRESMSIIYFFQELRHNGHG
jgi:hypothetical protein